MTESAPRTDKRFQVTVMGALALAAIVMMGAMATILQTSTIRWAGILLTAGLVIAIGYLLLEL